MIFDLGLVQRSWVYANIGTHHHSWKIAYLWSNCTSRPGHQTDFRFLSAFL